MWHIMLGEFLGCVFLILFGNGVVANVVLALSKGEHAGWITITAGWAFAVLIAVFIASAAGSSQADINPAVSLAKYLLGTYSNFTHTFCRMSAQLIGCFVGAILVWLIYFPHFAATENKKVKLLAFSTMPAIAHTPSNLLCEIIATFSLVFSIGALLHYSHLANDLIPYFIGLIVWGIGLSLGGPTGYAINPARDLGPRIAHAVLPISGKGNSGWAYAWVPILGPFIGAVIAALMWHWIFPS